MNLTMKYSDTCAVCDNDNLEEIIKLPGLPLTDTYCDKEMEDPYGGIDQSLLYCPICTHSQLHNIVDPNILYNDRYHFRTSESATARKGTEFFFDCLSSLFPGKKYQSVLDVGCNDLYLLKKLQPFTERGFGIDPVWAGKEEEVNDSSIKVFGKCFEDMSRGELSDLSPDLVVCRHSLEHISNPRSVLQYLIDAARDNAVFLIEIPGFEPLVTKQRFDHIFHQHLQYFSLKSILRLLEEVGGRYVSHAWNYHDWGSLLVAFTKKGKNNPVNELKRVNVDTIRENYKLFQRQFETAGEVLHSFKEGSIYGYGAAQMLPVISYHLKNNLSCLESVLDDDPRKDGLYYWNLPVKVCHISKAGAMEQSTVFITAIDNFKPILRRLIELNPKNIIYPLHII